MSKLQWALTVFNEWKAARNEMAIKEDSDISIIRVELIEMTKDELCHSLSRFVLEARKRSGEDYPAETVYELIISLQLYLTSEGKEYKFLVDKEFVIIHSSHLSSHCVIFFSVHIFTIFLCFA